MRAVEDRGAQSKRTKGDDIPRTTSRTEVGSAKASRMNSCGIFGSATFSILTIQNTAGGERGGALGETRPARLTGSLLVRIVVDVRRG